MEKPSYPNKNIVVKTFFNSYGSKLPIAALQSLYLIYNYLAKRYNGYFSSSRYGSMYDCNRNSLEVSKMFTYLDIQREEPLLCKL
jgi:hypothetical protein